MRHFRRNPGACYYCGATAGTRHRSGCYESGVHASEDPAAIATPDDEATPAKSSTDRPILTQSLPRDYEGTIPHDIECHGCGCDNEEFAQDCACACHAPGQPLERITIWKRVADSGEEPQAHNFTRTSWNQFKARVQRDCNHATDRLRLGRLLYPGDPGWVNSVDDEFRVDEVVEYVGTYTKADLEEDPVTGENNLHDIGVFDGGDDPIHDEEGYLVDTEVDDDGEFYAYDRNARGRYSYYRVKTRIYTTNP